MTVPPGRLCLQEAIDNLETFLMYMTGEGAIGISWAEAKDVANPPTMCRTASITEN